MLATPFKPETLPITLQTLDEFEQWGSSTSKVYKSSDVITAASVVPDMQFAVAEMFA